MKATDLRLSNLVYYKLFPNVKESFIEVEVLGLNKNTVTFSFEGNEKSVYFEEIEHIQLTEELLFRFGFEQIGSYKTYRKTYSDFGYEKQLVIEGEKGFSASIMYDEKFAMITMLSTVHELQNLYFLVAREELIPSFVGL